LKAAQPVRDVAESSAELAGDFLHDDVWAGNVRYSERGALLIDWASATIGDRRIDLAYALLSIRSSGTRPPQVVSQRGRVSALLAGANAYQPAHDGRLDSACCRLCRRWPTAAG
jgi:aminoglycoside phosphotransferase (APT) family kinase protein